MASEKYQQKLPEIKKDIQFAYDSFRNNYLSYHDSMRFAFKSALTDDDIAYLQSMNKPTLEFNIGEAYLSRLCGEYAKQEPSINVSASSGGGSVNPQIIRLVEGICKGILDAAKNDDFQYTIYRQQLAGGFGVAKVSTEYTNEMSFDQDIKVECLPDPTMAGFDPAAKKSHKGDGQFCFEIYPKHRDEVKEMFGSKAVENLKFTKNGIYDENGFNWSFKSNKEDVVVLCDYFKKKRKKSEIVQLLTGQVLTVDDYEKLVAIWSSSGMMGSPPPVVGKSRKTHLTYVCRYRTSGNIILDYKETDYKYLPLVFFDGNSVLLCDSTDGQAKQMTRSYLYQAVGMQRLMNFAGQTLANEIENIVQHKLMIEKDAIDESYLDPLKNIQKASVVVYKGFRNDDPDVRLNPPQPVPRIPAPPEVAATFNNAATIMQQILGSYDAALGVNQNQLSGIAIEESATQSNATAMPCLIGNLRGLNQVANIVVDLIPKYMNTSRQVPTMLMNGKKEMVNINSSPETMMKYDSGALNVKVSAGVNFAVQQQRSVNVMTTLMKEVPTFAKFMNEEGLETLLDNIDIRGIDGLKQQVAEFTKRMKAEQQQQAQIAMQTNPGILKAKELQLKEKEGEVNATLQAAKININQEEQDTNRMLALSKIGQMTDQATLQREKVQAENSRTAVELATMIADKKHSHAKEILQMHHSNQKIDKVEPQPLKPE